MLYEQGSHEIRGAFFTDSNELDPAVVTERSMFGLKKVFFCGLSHFDNVQPKLKPFLTRTGDRFCAIPFTKSMRETRDFFERQTRLRELLVSKEKPFGWTVRIK